ncbi:MAG: S8 family peptidase, partial [Bacteroidota bacterium]
ECFQWFLAPTNSNGNNPDATKAPHVINNSWGCPTSEGCNSGNFATMEAVVNSLKTAGIVVVVSAGNSGSGCNTVNTPAAIYENSFSVGATNSSDNIAGFSSRGPVTVDGSGRAKPNVSAPGVAVRSCIRNGRYASFQGTSMAGPHVAGAVALIISADPGLAGQVEVIESALETTSVGRTTTQNCGGVSGSSIPNNTYGYGRIDALAAINSLLPLPVDLTSFYAVPEKKYVRVHWQTSAELNSDHFVLEKSLDLNHWSAIGTVEARSNSQVQVDYSFDDLHPQAGSNYYRLRQVDRDGSHEYSKVVTAVYEDAGKNVRIFPNPIREEVKLRFAEIWTGGQLSVFNALGQLVHQQPLARQPKGSDFMVDASTWSEGMYFLNLQDANGQLVKQEKLLKH